ncbi:DNA polymerase/3'-5' exonuclease PolX [candidate division WWE3 bacterium]|nr:DNA polymerase/3'-5' exonuclease PolX [candidate division WWE3 bacterium]
MPRFSNKEVLVMLKEAVAAMEIKGDNKFGIRAYQNAISSIEGLTMSVYDLWENDRLGEISGVGAALVQHLSELFKTGKATEWENKKKDLPDGMFALLVLRGVGAKTAFKLSKEFNILSRIDALEKIKEAAKKGLIQKLPGFGPKSEKDILDSVDQLKKSKQEKQRMLLSQAEDISSRIISYLKQIPEVNEAISLGSLRRRAATVGDLDIAVSSKNPEKVIEHFITYPEIKNVESKGDRMSTVILTNDTQIDVLVSDIDSYGSLLQHFTGSKQHNIRLRQHALDLGLSLSQYGIKQGNKLKKFEDEKKFYGFMGLSFVPPELREGKDEIELAALNALPELVKVSDIKGDLHVHTTASDGVNTLNEMVEAAIELGYEFIGIADHAPSVINRGIKEVEQIMQKRREEIEKINSSQKKIKVLFGYEVNILKDATLAMPDELLKKLDYVIASIHTSFDMPREEVTKRTIAALENPYVTILGHPSGRTINQREALDLDWTKVFEAALKNKKILEINGQPSRLDLPDHLVYDAIKMGIPMMIGSDAHSVTDLLYMKSGIDVARRGWCTKKEVLNTLTYKELQNILH